ncbi:MAG: hypothetical protein DCF25_05955 [Leptolyngbya foveolarum]|uniref:Uncharacterized protein n=1 Tax=Leptolyngbya foveolarum TaxID=47253 RepID=A0A2W4UIU2_9CYAN|nr:MAG: hypothetical protein DCF25_05955 [Leptolyngbya foveolarum]
MALSLEQKRKAIEADIIQRKEQLAQKEDELMHLQILIPQLKAAIANHESMLKSLTRGVEESTDTLNLEQTIHRSPMDMLRNEFKGMRLGNIAAQVLDEHSISLTTTELARLIYETKNSDEFSRARNSLSAELRTGVRDSHPRWKKIGRNAYASLQYSQEEAA